MYQIRTSIRSITGKVAFRVRDGNTGYTVKDMAEKISKRFNVPIKKVIISITYTNDSEAYIDYFSKRVPESKRFIDTQIVLDILNKNDKYWK